VTLGAEGKTASRPSFGEAEGALPHATLATDVLQNVKPLVDPVLIQGICLRISCQYDDANYIAAKESLEPN
jgi:hypothetical protein